MQILALFPESRVQIYVITSYICSSWKVKGGFGRACKINQQTPRISRVKVPNATALHSLFKPKSEICSVTNHFQEIWGVNFLIFLSPHTANKFRRLHSPGNDKTGGKMLSTNKNCHFCVCIKRLFLPLITTWYFTNPVPPNRLQNNLK